MGDSIPDILVLNTHVRVVSPGILVLSVGGVTPFDILILNAGGVTPELI